MSIKMLFKVEKCLTLTKHHMDNISCFTSNKIIHINGSPLAEVIQDFLFLMFLALVEMKLLSYIFVHAE